MDANPYKISVHFFLYRFEVGVRNPEILNAVFFRLPSVV